jgi:hypothetical protein
MSYYQSRYNPRQHASFLGKIENVERYDRYYDIAYEALRDGQLPHLTLPIGAFLVRVMKGPYDPLQIPPGSSMNAGNRFSGRRLDGRPGQGALYVATIAGVLREHAHYSLLSKTTAFAPPIPPLYKPGAPDATRAFIDAQLKGAPPPSADSKFYLLRVSRALRFADLRISSIAPLMYRIRLSGREGNRYGITESSPVDFQISAPSDAVDYSASRGMADAVFDRRATTGDAGVCAFSSRADTDAGIVVPLEGDPTCGLVFAILGPDSEVVSALSLVPKDAAHKGFDTYAELRSAIV